MLRLGIGADLAKYRSHAVQFLFQVARRAGLLFTIITLQIFVGDDLRRRLLRALTVSAGDVAQRLSPTRDRQGQDCEHADPLHGESLASTETDAIDESNEVSQPWIFVSSPVLNS